MAIEWNVPVVVSCSIPAAIAMLRYNIKLIFRMILHQLKLPRRRHIIIRCACLSATICRWSALAVAGPVQTILLV